MSDLIIKHPERATDTFPLGRLRITIGRSARNDVCIPDPFASRVHAEVRREGDGYVLQDLGSANGTLYNGERLRAPVTLTPGGRVQIGETEIEYAEPTVSATFSSIADEMPSATPEATISLNSEQRSTSGLLEAIEEARTQKSGELPRSSRGDSGALSGQRTAVTPGRVVAAAAAMPAPARVMPVANARGGDEHGDLLALISKVSVTLLAPATLDEIMRQIVALVFEAVPADRCLIMLRDGAGGDELKVRVAQLRDQQQSSGVGEIRVSRSIIEEVVAQGRSVLTSDAQHDPRFMSNTMTIQGIRSVLAVPLGVGAKIFGIIYADSPLGEAKFTQDHLTVLTTLASVAAIRVENARLVEEQLDRERLERELSLAREIQERFQPASSPQVPGYELQGISFPCYEIGGDYYDFIPRHDGRMVVALGDVSGKGTSAALLMSSLHAAIHAQVATHKSIVETIGAVNRYLAETIPSNRFITLFYAELDPLTGGLAFLNAGHNPPIIIHAAGTMEQLGAGGMPLGISHDAPYREGRTQLQPGDVLVAYSDGVTETQNQAGEEFGPLRLQEVIARNLNASAAGIRDKIEAALTKFAQGTPSVDDITLVIVKRQE